MPSAERAKNDSGSAIFSEHLSRYHLAAKFVGGRSVLEVSCGTGLGLQVLAEAAPDLLIAADYDAESIDAARSMAPSGVSCVRLNGIALPFPDAVFEIVISFETIEHIADDVGFLRELRRVLRPDGLLLLSTPNAVHTQPLDNRPENPFHVREYLPKELLEVLLVDFSAVRLLGHHVSEDYGPCPYWQKRVLRRNFRSRITSLGWKLIRRGPQRWRQALSRAFLRRSFLPGVNNFSFSTELESAHVLVAVCHPSIRSERASEKLVRMAEIVVCPECGAPLLPAGTGPWSALACSECNSSWPVTEGVPRLWRRPREEIRTSETFGFEFTAIEDDQQSWEEIIDQFLLKTGLPADREALLARRPQNVLDGKLFLDAGCGMGRYSRVARLLGAEVIGIDISNGVYRAAREFQDDPGAHFIQASLLNLPLRDGVLDGAFSIGVLHHTAAPEDAFRQIARKLKLGGLCAVWVYPPGYWNGPVRGTVVRAVRRVLLRLPPRATYLFAAAVFPLGRIQGFLSGLGRLRYFAAPLFLLPVPRHPKRGVMLSTIYDYYSPEFINTYTSADVQEWFRQAGFSSIRELTAETALTGIKGPMGVPNETS